MNLTINCLKINIKITLKNKAFILLFLALVQIANAQSVEIDKTTLALHEEVAITITFPLEYKKDIRPFSFPEIQNFIKVKTLFEEDKKIKVYKIVQSYRPLKEGIFKISPFRLPVSGQGNTFPGANLTVINSSQKYNLPREFLSTEFKTSQEELFFQVVTNKRSVYTGEGFTITASLLIGENNQTGFNFFDLEEQMLEISRKLVTHNALIDKSSKGIIEQLQFDTIRIEDKFYKRLKLFESKIYPVYAVDFNFPPIEFRILKYLTSKGKNQILWKAEEVSLSSSTLKVSVKPLPDHPLKDQVPIGRFHLKEDINSLRTNTGSRLKYNFIIEGGGNPATILAPDIRENDWFDFFTPDVKEHVLEKNNVTLYQKVFSYYIIPKEPGTYHLSDYFQWIYFDPFKDRYDTLKSNLLLTVTGESQKNKTIASLNPTVYYPLENEDNQLRHMEEDQTLKFFANIIILFMLVTTVILTLRR